MSSRRNRQEERGAPALRPQAGTSSTAPSKSNKEEFWRRQEGQGCHKIFTHLGPPKMEGQQRLNAQSSTISAYNDAPSAQRSGYGYGQGQNQYEQQKQPLLNPGLTGNVSRSFSGISIGAPIQPPSLWPSNLQLPSLQPPSLQLPSLKLPSLQQLELQSPSGIPLGGPKIEGAREHSSIFPCRRLNCKSNFIRLRNRTCHEEKACGQRTSPFVCKEPNCGTATFHSQEDADVHDKWNHSDHSRRHWCHLYSCPKSFGGDPERELHEREHTNGDFEKQVWCREGCDCFWETKDEMLDHLTEKHPQPSRTDYKPPGWLRKRPWLSADGKVWVCQLDDGAACTFKPHLLRHQREKHLNINAIGIFLCEFDWCEVCFKYDPERIREHMKNHDKPEWVRKTKAEFERNAATTAFGDSGYSGAERSRVQRGASSSVFTTSPPRLIEHKSHSKVVHGSEGQKTHALPGNQSAHTAAEGPHPYSALTIRQNTGNGKEPSRPATLYTREERDGGSQTRMTFDGVAENPYLTSLREGTPPVSMWSETSISRRRREHDECLDQSHGSAQLHDSTLPYGLAQSHGPSQQHNLSHHRSPSQQPRPVKAYAHREQEALGGLLALSTQPILMRQASSDSTTTRRAPPIGATTAIARPRDSSLAGRVHKREYPEESEPARPSKEVRRYTSPAPRRGDGRNQRSGGG